MLKNHYLQQLRSKIEKIKLIKMKKHIKYWNKLKWNQKNREENSKY